MDFSSGCGTSTSGGTGGGQTGRDPKWLRVPTEAAATPRTPSPCRSVGTRGNGWRAPTFRVQQARHPQVPLSHGEGLVQVLQVALAVHLVHVDEHGPAGRGQGALSCCPPAEDPPVGGGQALHRQLLSLQGSRGHGQQHPPPPLPHGTRFWQPESSGEPWAQRSHPPRVLPAPLPSLSMRVLCSTAWGARGPTRGHRELRTPPDPPQEPGEPGTILLQGPWACRAREAPAQSRVTNSPSTNPRARGAFHAPSPEPTGTGSQQQPRAGTPRGRQCPTSPCTDPKTQPPPSCIHPPALLSLPSQGPQQERRALAPIPSSPQPHGGTLRPRHAQGVGRGTAPPAQHPGGLSAPPRPQPPSYSSLRRRVECTE